eukprot:CAMPEP_0198439316 /NCGR_PEP_ID=MMETSP1452-20131203/54532_1 /TAXON_ID=1181717 /ORGANISM="Synchroma pusillum, Strain CCMP3072" /LENGTH=447 /DNA_ID=CAMNT_0044159923 /DNA_START=45 /DNA_END=1385 /DNA_ORIENTATION=-
MALHAASDAPPVARAETLRGSITAFARAVAAPASGGTGRYKAAVARAAASSAAATSTAEPPREAVLRAALASLYPPAWLTYGGAAVLAGSRLFYASNTRTTSWALVIRILLSSFLAAVLTTEVYNSVATNNARIRSPSDGAFLPLAGLDVHYTTSPAPASSSSAACFIHGFGANCHSYTPVQSLAASALGMDVHALDQPPFGRTQRPPPLRFSPYDPCFSAAACHRLLSPAKHRRLISGHSYGAQAALAAAQLSPPNSTTLVLEAPALTATTPIPTPEAVAAAASAPPPPRPEGLAALARIVLLVPYLVAIYPSRLLLKRSIASFAFWRRGLQLARHPDSALPDSLLLAYMAPMLNPSWDRCMVEFSLSKALPALLPSFLARLLPPPPARRPALAVLRELAAAGMNVVILHGDGDAVVPLANSHALAEAVGGGLSLQVLPRCGHVPH